MYTIGYKLAIIYLLKIEKFIVNLNLLEECMDKLNKKMERLEKEYDRNPFSVLKNAKIMKRAAKLQAKIDNRRRK